MTAPAAVSSAGIEAIELAEAVGLVLDPWQAFAVEVILSERADGNWAAFESGLLVARQNGKGGILEALELAGLFLFGERLIMHSAHEFKTAMEAFLRVQELIEGSPSLSKMVARVRRSNGDEGIELKTGQRLRFVARSKGSGRGFTGDRLILDEAQELPLLAMGAMLPTLSARPNAQVIYTGTVPGPENDAEHWEAVRDRGRAGDDPGLAWIEWSPDPDVDDPDLPPDIDDQVVWRATNPSIDAGRPNGITVEAVARERRALPDDVFARERLSWWPSAQGSGVVSMVRFDRAKSPLSQIVGSVAFGVDIPYDREHGMSVIYAAGRAGDGRWHVEGVDAHEGASWVQPRLAELLDRHDAVGFGVDANGPAGELGDLERAVRLSSADMAAAAGGFLDLLADNQLAHLGDDLLRKSCEVSARRAQGERWVWRRKGEQLSTPLIAASVALWLAQHPPEKNKRTGIVV